MTLTRRIRLTAAGVIATAAVAAAGVGAHATFTSATTSPTQPIGTGSVQLTLSDAANAASWPQPIGPLAAGDTTAHYVDLANSGSLALSKVTLTASSTGDTLLTTGSSAVTVTIDACPSAWSPSTNSCSTAPVPVLPATAIGAVTGAPLAAAPTAPGAVTHLRFTLTLPASADNSYQGLSSVVTWQFVATQRAAQTSSS